MNERIAKAVRKRRRRAARKDASNYAKKNLLKREFPVSGPKGRSWQTTRAIGNLLTLRYLQKAAEEFKARLKKRVA